MHTDTLQDISLPIIDEIITECEIQGKVITVSKTGDGEKLIYTQRNGTYYNILIDEDGDVEFMTIPLDWSQATNEHFRAADEISVPKLVSKL